MAGWRASSSTKWTTWTGCCISIGPAMSGRWKRAPRPRRSRRIDPPRRLESNRLPRSGEPFESYQETKKPGFFAKHPRRESEGTEKPGFSHQPKPIPILISRIEIAVGAFKTCPPEGHTCPDPQVLGRDGVGGRCQG